MFQESCFGKASAASHQRAQPPGLPQDAQPSMSGKREAVLQVCLLKDSEESLWEARTSPGVGAVSEWELEALGIN